MRTARFPKSLAMRSSACTPPTRSASNFQIYGLIQNLFDQRYYTAGALFDTSALPNTAPYLTNPTSLGPAKPFAIYGGLRITL